MQKNSIIRHKELIFSNKKSTLAEWIFKYTPGSDVIGKYW